LTTGPSLFALLGIGCSIRPSRRGSAFSIGWCLMTKAKLLAKAAAFGLWALPSNAASLAPKDAVSHIGENATVCGVVALTNFDADTQFWPTFLDFGKPYPHQVFTAVILGADRAKFGTPETTLQGKRVCASGTIREYRGKPEIILTDPRRLVQ
jgi:hypothetical protein